MHDQLNMATPISMKRDILSFSLIWVDIIAGYYDNWGENSKYFMILIIP